MIRKKVFITITGFFLSLGITAQSNTEFDIVFSGGRVMDPETKLNATRNVGIIGNKIAAISETALKGKKVIDISGLVLAPGFIDMHVHGRSNKEQEYQLHDGLTTALELEWGIEHIAQCTDIGLLIYKT